MAAVVEAVEVSAPAERVWDLLTDWPRQGTWMLATHVRALEPDHGVGARLEAVTGLGPLGLRDRMTVTEWDPPRRCVVAHQGPAFRGEGVFEVLDLGDSRSRVVWSERVDAPAAVAGLGWAVVRPLLRAGLLVSLRRLAARAEAAIRR